MAWESSANDLLESTPPRHAPYRRALVVANPIAGRGKGGKAARELSEGLRRLGIPASTHLTSGRGDARERVARLEDDVDLVIAVGGDGTLREVLEGLQDTSVPVGLLPLGTANVLAGELGLPRDVHEALEVFAQRHTRRIDVSRVNDELSFLVTGVGPDAMAVREVERLRRGAITKLHYVWALFATLLRYRAPKLKVEIDGDEVPGEYGFVMVSNTKCYAGVAQLDPATRMDDGRYEVYLFPARGRLQLIAIVLRGILRSLPGRLGTLHRATQVRVTSPEPAPYQVDGDYHGETPVEIAVPGRQVRLLTPPTS